VQKVFAETETLSKTHFFIASTTLRKDLATNFGDDKKYLSRRSSYVFSCVHKTPKEFSCISATMLMFGVKNKETPDTFHVFCHQRTQARKVPLFEVILAYFCSGYFTI